MKKTFSMCVTHHCSNVEIPITWIGLLARMQSCLLENKITCDIKSWINFLARKFHFWCEIFFLFCKNCQVYWFVLKLVLKLHQFSSMGKSPPLDFRLGYLGIYVNANQIIFFQTIVFFICARICWSILSRKIYTIGIFYFLCSTI